MDHQNGRNSYGKNHYGKGSNYSGGSFGRNSGQGSYRKDEKKARPKKEKKPFPGDYVEYADTLMQQQCKNITTSKLRKILSLFMDVYNTENLRTDEAIAQENVTRLQLAKIRLVYECGREKDVKAFAEDAYLFHWLKEAGTSREMVLRYIHYLEALVAYHRYHNEGEN